MRIIGTALLTEIPVLVGTIGLRLLNVNGRWRWWNDDDAWWIVVRRRVIEGGRSNYRPADIKAKTVMAVSMVPVSGISLRNTHASGKQE
jgi:hypothetical protein